MAWHQDRRSEFGPFHLGGMSRQAGNVSHIKGQCREAARCTVSQATAFAVGSWARWVKREANCSASCAASMGSHFKASQRAPLNCKRSK
jgi:hypothetical protein